MPPSLPQDRESNLGKSSEPYYTNEDVAFLHDVVVYAQELLPGLSERERLPTNALFHAYYALLPSIGVNADHDSRYARVLFKIGGVRSNGSLYEKFEVVLSRMGIQIEFDQDNTLDGQEVTKDLRSTQSFESQSHVNLASSNKDEERGRRRRNSEGSTRGIGFAVYGGATSRPKPHSSLSRPRHASIAEQAGAGSYVSQTIQQAADRSPHQVESNDVVTNQKYHGLGIRLVDDAEGRIQDPRPRSTSAHGQIQVRRISPQIGDRLPSTIPILHADSDVYAVENKGNEQLYGRDEEPDHLVPPVPCSDNLEVKVTDIEQSRRRNLLHQIWPRWRLKASQLREDNSNLNILARYRDKQILLGQAFDSWRTSISERRQKTETERFFAHLEGRATRARNLFLLTKALSHWTYSASDELQRTSVARRHILRMRYFNAWLEITAVNELKVRRQVIRKFFNIWQVRQMSVIRKTQNATKIWRTGLMKTVFSAWFWDFCQRRAPIWREYRLQKRQLAVWHRISNRRRIDEGDAIDYFSRCTKHKLLIVWITKMRLSVTHASQAKNHKAICTVHKSLIEWYHSTVLLPLQRIARARNETRLQCDSFQQWYLLARHNEDAATIDRLKIMREAWALWNDKFRTNALQSQIGQRIVLQGLYKWVLTERLVLARRVVEKNAKRLALQKMIEAQRMCIVKDSRHCLSAQQEINRKSLQKTVHIWRHSLQVHLQHQHLASDFDSPRILNIALSKWFDRTQQNSHLQKWAHDGEFYFLSSKAIQRWRLAMESIKREKRRTMYAQFRRKSKVSLATRIFSTWGAHTLARVDTIRLAGEVRHNKHIILCIEVFDRWRGRAEEVAEMRMTTHVSLLRKSLNEMRMTLRIYLRSEADALEFLEDHLSALSLKKWSRFALQIRARQHLVSELREKYIKRSSRKILAHWRQRTSQGPQGFSSAGQEFPSNDRLQRSIVAPAEPSERSMPWLESGNWEAAAPGVGMHGAASSVRIPGYLSTPSKKISRNRVMTRMPSTTPSAPLSTQAEMQLRAQYSGGPLSSFQKALARNSRGPRGALEVQGDEMAESKGKL